MKQDRYDKYMYYCISATLFCGGLMIAAIFLDLSRDIVYHLFNLSMTFMFISLSALAIDLFKPETDKDD